MTFPRRSAIRSCNVGFEMKLVSKQDASRADVEYIRVLLSVGASAPVRAIRGNLAGYSIKSMFPALGQYTYIQVLTLSGFRLNLWGIIALVKQLPLLPDVHSLTSKFGPLPSGVSRKGLPKYVLAKHASCGRRLRCWRFSFGDDDDVEESMHCVLLVALVCLNFDYAAVDSASREPFMVHMKVIATDGFGPHASRLQRLLLGGAENKFPSLAKALADKKSIIKGGFSWQNIVADLRI